MSLIFCSNVGKIKCKAWQTNLQHCNNTERYGFFVYYSARRTYRMQVYFLPKRTISFRTALMFCASYLCTRTDVLWQKSPGSLTGRSIVLPAHNVPRYVWTELSSCNSWAETALNLLLYCLCKDTSVLVLGRYLLQVTSFCHRGNGKRRRNVSLSWQGQCELREMLGRIPSWCQSHSPRCQLSYAEELQTWACSDHTLFLYGSIDVTDFLLSPSCSHFPVSWTRSPTSVKSQKTGPNRDCASLHTLTA